MKNLEMHSARKSTGGWLLLGLAAAFILTGVCLRIFFPAAPLEPKWFEVIGILLGGWAVAPISRMLQARVDPVRARRAEIEDRDERIHALNDHAASLAYSASLILSIAVLTVYSLATQSVPGFDPLWFALSALVVAPALVYVGALAWLNHNR